MKKTDLGVFLHRTSYSETSLIVWFYTKTKGLQKFIFKGGKKKAHALFPMSLAELTYYGKEDADLLNLTSVETVSPATFLSNPMKITIAFFMAETIRKCVEQGDKDAELFLFIERQINQLSVSNEVAMLPLVFLVEGTKALGFFPLCEDETARFFNLDSGRFLLTASTHQATASGDGVELIRNVMISNQEAATPTKAARMDALKIMMDYYKIHVPRFDTLSSYEIVKEVLQA